MTPEERPRISEALCDNSFVIDRSADKTVSNRFGDDPVTRSGSSETPPNFSLLSVGSRKSLIWRVRWPRLITMPFAVRTITQIDICTLAQMLRRADR